MTTFLLPNFVFAEFTTEDVIAAARTQRDSTGEDLRAFRRHVGWMGEASDYHKKMSPLSTEIVEKYAKDNKVKEEIIKAWNQARKDVAKQTGWTHMHGILDSQRLIFSEATNRVARKYGVTYEDITIILSSLFPYGKDTPEEITKKPEYEYQKGRPLDDLTKTAQLWNASSPTGPDHELTLAELNDIKTAREKRQGRPPVTAK